nr:MAG TPA: hypothetical protein [Caudoviricetes sp.]
MLLCNVQPCPRSALGLPYEKFRIAKPSITHKVMKMGGLP